MPSSSFIEYKEAIGILEHTSKHISLVTETIKNKILPKLSHRHRLLDVGAGAGNITKILQSEFDEAVAVEINPELKNAYHQTNIKLYNSDFMNVVLEGKFDLVICSHVMYHLNKSEMSAFIDKLLSLVNPGGYCFIALMAPRGQNHKFHEAFNPDYINSKLIITILNERQITYDRIEVQNSFTTNNSRSMCNLLKFFAIEDCQTKATKDLNAEEMKQIEIKAEQQAIECNTAAEFELQQEEDYFVIPRF
ncbi:class I SAM-dependent methyltransferase [Legionella tucsonensis]|uniref:Bifunctional 3-demethylubiquinone-9 3-methyltransferase/ 2-octaprenyl-6-hydroxy phenol methylase n=1 Tax=Legionella tucsonensis TaxID=40335 RepID=A0A0W0ZUB6_9GAMM|nr:class I SAM-dependent methyltransferase [Legionella tucsonensis]KTD72764.1 bifunctional 3-demethylubiquinone-9 3-methyltransferase/ 2-octaprenyl-6-hydroxy phenol methylase [Legionella tucsonensis]